MPEQTAAEKTEQPTSRRLSKAREQGQVPQSQELVSVAALMALVVTLALLAPNILQWFIIKTRHGLSSQIDVFSDGKAFINFINNKIAESIVLISPILIALLAASALSSGVVGGFSFSPQAVKFRWNSINPATVIKNLISTRSLVRLIVSIGKLLFVSIIVWLYLHSKLDTLAALRWAWTGQIISVIARIIFGLCIRIGIALLAIGIADAFYQKWRYIQELKMTRQEVKQERKDTEGSPEVKARIRRIQVQMSMKRMLQEVPKASVILVNPTHIAVALRYEAKKMEAPILTAKGADHLAEKIIQIGRSYGVPIVRRPELARTIYSTVEIGNLIPQALYIAVAEVLAIIHRLRQRKKSTINRLIR
jgi:flagellar biosynthetic protein FlhB